MKHLTVIPGGKRDGFDPSYWLHPVHGVRAVEQRARETVAQAFAGPGEPPHMVALAASVLAAAVHANDRRLTPAVREAFEVLSAFFSTPADACNPHGMERLFPVDPDGGAA